ncbi:MAG: hypothetical protein K5678_02240 [Acetatifactor sp.]|nr:hypothetical protein [Acetatifactor sp.]
MRWKGFAKNCIAILVFCGLLVWVASRVYNVLSWKDTTGDYLSSTSQLYHTPENTIDVVFMGSSHCYCGVYPAYLWRDKGIAAFDMSVSGQDRASTVHMLIETLKTQQPKVVMVDVYGLLFDRNEIEGNVYRNMLSMKPSKNSVELVQEYVEPEKQLDYLLRWPIVHTRFWELGKYDFIQYEPSIYGRGALFSWHESENQDAGAWRETAADELRAENKEWLDRLIAMHEEHGFELSFFVVPFRITLEEQMQVNAARSYLTALGYDFLDMNQVQEDLGLDLQKDFMDDKHCNANGAEKVTLYLEDYLTEKFTLADHRGDAAYTYWDQDLEWFEHAKLKQALSETEDPAEQLELLLDGQDLTMVISVEGNAEKPELLLRLGLSEAEIAAGGKWILRGGQLKKIMENDSEVKAYTEDISKTDAIRIRYKDERDAFNIQFNYDACCDPRYATDVICYDAFLNDLMTIVHF